MYTQTQAFGLIILFYFIFFAAVLKVFLYRNPRHMVDWGITTFAASVSEGTVASSCRNFYFRSGIVINRER